MAGTFYGYTRWGLTRDSDGYREYTLVTRVVMDSVEDGPAMALLTPGVFRPGAAWNVKNDQDTWVWCRPNAKVSPVIDGENNDKFDIEQTFSNKPYDSRKGESQRCQEQQIDNPLLQPVKVSGGFVTSREEAMTDRFGRMVTSSSWEIFRGNQVEFDVSRPTIRLEQNVASLNLPTLAGIIDFVNSIPMWGLPTRCVKLSKVTWEELYWGLCFKYFRRTLEFDINAKTFDRELLDEGNKCLHGEPRDGAWTITPVDSIGTLPNRFNPQHFVRYKDQNGENTRCILDGFGKPINLINKIEVPIMEPAGDGDNTVTWAGGTASLQVTRPHGLSIGNTITVSGIVMTPATATGYNGEFTITGIVNIDDSKANIQYTIAVDPGTVDKHKTADKGRITRTMVLQNAPGKVLFQRYPETNFFTLGGIPVAPGT